jgi:hypothetical protein
MSADTELIDSASITNALSRHTSSLKARQMDAVVKAESEVLKISGSIPGDAAQAAGAGSSADTSQLLAAVNAAIAESELRMQSFMREEIRRAVITITKLEVRDISLPLMSNCNIMKLGTAGRAAAAAVLGAHGAVQVRRRAAVARRACRWLHVAAAARVCEAFRL